LGHLDLNTTQGYVAAMFKPTSRAGGQRGRRTSIATRLRRNGPSSSSTSVAGRWRSATASDLTILTVRTSMPVFAVPCCAWTRTNFHVWC
jgi:hypothetical protein